MARDVACARPRIRRSGDDHRRHLGVHDPTAISSRGDRARELRGERGHQGLRRQRRAAHRVSRRAPHLRSPPADPEVAARSRDRDRGRPLLLPPRTGSDGRRARHLSEFPPRPHRRGWQHHHPAARQGTVPHAGQEPRAQAEGGRAGGGARAPLFEGSDPRALPQPDLLRSGRVRRRGGLSDVLRKVDRRADAGRDGAARRAAEGTRDLLAIRSPGRRQAATEHRARADGRDRRTLRRRGQARGSGGTRSRPARAPADDRPVLPRIRAAPPRAAVWRRGRLQGRSSRLHDAVSVDAAQSRRDAARGPPRRRGPARRRGREGQARAGPIAGRPTGGRPPVHRAADRIHQGDGRRVRLLQERVQPGGPGAAPARVRLQAVRVHRRSRIRHDGGQRGGGRARRVHGRKEQQALEAGQLRSEVPRTRSPSSRRSRSRSTSPP